MPQVVEWADRERSAWGELSEGYQSAMRVFRLERDYARNALKTQYCIRPPNGKPDDYTVEQCVNDGHCGCDCKLGLEGVTE